MIAIYARQSVDKADSISIESQIEFCRYETKGEEAKLYIDRGFSGKSTDRPAFSEMMRDIKNGRIRKVVVYKLDRISRSILDFSSMMEQFERWNVEFVSNTEKFDTSSPMGRAMLNICIVFAQLERETIQKRVADAYFSRCQKSLYMGGQVPYGFRLVPTVIDGVKTSMYEAVPDEAEQIQRICALYARPGTSYGDIQRHFQEHGLLKRGKPWERARLGDVLRNPIYVRADFSVYEYYRKLGVIPVNSPGDFVGTNGCYRYKGPKGNAKNPEKSFLVLAPHEGIVSSELWLQCQARRSEPHAFSPAQKAKNTWLAGKIKCGVCGYALVDKHSAGDRFRYFRCSNRMNAGACSGPGLIRSGELEEIVYREILGKMALFSVLHSSEKRPAPAAVSSLQLSLSQTEREIGELMERLTGADTVLYRYIEERIRSLDRKKQELSAHLAAHRQTEGSDRDAISDPMTMWEMLCFEDKRLVTDLLIRVIYATRDSVQIEWRF